MDLVVEVIYKDVDKILVTYGNIFQCLGAYLVKNVQDICISIFNKVLNTIKTIVVSIPQNWVFTLQSKYIGEDMFQFFPGLFEFQKNFVASIRNIIKVVGEFLIIGWMKHLTRFLSCISKI